MADEALVRYVWLAPVVWAVLHLSDYYTSLFVARLYAASASHTIVFEGGIELTPRFRQDIASLRLVSRVSWSLSASSYRHWRWHGWCAWNSSASPCRSCF